MDYPGYDFFRDDFADGMRHPFLLIEWWFMDACFSYSKRKLLNSADERGAWEDEESEFAYAYREYVDVFDLPVERLMLEVVVLFAYGGRAPQGVERAHRDNIASILSICDIDDLIVGVPNGEATTFVADLKALGFV